MTDESPWAPWAHSAPGSQGGASADDEVTFLRARVGVFGRVGAALSVVFYGVVNALTQVGTGERGGWLALPALLVLSVAALLAGLWALSRSNQRAASTLRAAEAGVVIAVCAIATAYGWVGAGFASFKLNALLVPANVLTFRAILVPSRPSRTVWIGALAVLPSLVVAFAAWRWPGESAPGVAQVEAALFTAWSLVSVALSTTVSWVVYGLRREVRHALRLGQYVLEEKIGEGAMGSVYRARHALLRRPTAVKLLRPDQGGARAAANFEREVQLTSGLTHPNTIAIYDYGHTADGVFYYAMELLDGLNLEALVERWGPLPPGLVIHILHQVCGSLAEAHDRGLVHRDVKAANIILCERGGVEDVVKVLDFGLVREVSDAGDAQVCGTPVYLAPEGVTAPQSVDARTDLYAVGVLGYYLLTGTHPFEHDDILVTLTSQVAVAPEPPSRRRPVPADLEAVLMRCLEKAPGDRPQRAQTLREALDACADARTWTPDAPRPWREARAETTKPSAAPTLIQVDLLARRDVEGVFERSHLVGTDTVRDR
ncbi:MAG: serine/threonine-protein kinase [Polyangiales bacterium]